MTVFTLRYFLLCVGVARGPYHPNFQDILPVYAVGGGVPNKILLLTNSQTIWPLPNFRAGCATAFILNKKTCKFTVFRKDGDDVLLKRGGFVSTQTQNTCCD